MRSSYPTLMLLHLRLTVAVACNVIEPTWEVVHLLGRNDCIFLRFRSVCYGDETFSVLIVGISVSAIWENSDFSNKPL